MVNRQTVDIMHRIVIPFINEYNEEMELVVRGRSKWANPFHSI